MKSRCLIFCALISDLCAFLTVAQIFIFFFCWLLSNWSQEQACSKSYFIYTYVCIYMFASLPMKSASDVVRAASPSPSGAGILAQSNMVMTQRTGRRGTRGNSMVQSTCNFSTDAGNQRGAKLGCGLQWSGVLLLWCSCGNPRLILRHTISRTDREAFVTPLVTTSYHFTAWASSGWRHPGLVLPTSPASHVQSR